MAYTSMRRVGTFLPSRKKDAEDFSWIVPRFIRYFEDTDTLLIQLPRDKADPEGKGIVLTFKPTGDNCCPIRLTLRLAYECVENQPIFVTSARIPLQSWLLQQIRRRMANLGKDPRLFGLRSIRKGSTTTACEDNMPEVFLRASGGWKGRAMELYRSERFPTEQAKFARRLGKQRISEIIEEDDDVKTPRPVQPNRVGRGSNWAKDFTAALPGRRPADTLWSRGGARPRRPEYNEATVSLETNKPTQSPTKPWSTQEQGLLFTFFFNKMVFS